MSICDLSCQDFINALASNQPYPGGGGAAALTGAIGIALGDMVGSFTVGKKKYADVEDDILSLKQRSAALEQQLLHLVDEDARVFAPLSKAYGLPSGTDEEKAYKSEVMEKCLKDAADVPMGIMRCAGQALELLCDFADKGSRMMISDAGCGAVCCRAALEAASLNVFINTKSMRDRVYADQLNQQADDMLVKYGALAQEIYQKVAKDCR